MPTLADLFAGLPAGFGWTLAGIAGLIAIDTLLAYALALKTRTWRWSKVGQFMDTSVLRYLGGGIVAAVTASLHPSWASVGQPAFYAAAGLVVAKYVFGDIRAKVLLLLAPTPPAKGA